MKAAVFKGKNVLEVEDVSEPKVGPRDVLLQVTHCAICGSDVHRYMHGMHRPGHIMGHEYAGIVVDRGEEVLDFQIGDRVTRWDGKISPVSNIYSSPRFSAREVGFMPGLRPGAYAEYVAVNEDRVTRIPEALTNLEACLIEPVAVALHGVRFSKARLGDRILVLGAGPIGLFTLLCGSLSGARDVFVSETNVARREMALRLGASDVFDPRRVNLVEEIVRRTGGIGVDLAFECAGAHTTLQQALETVRILGRVILLALAWEPVQCQPVDWVGRQVEMKAAYRTSPDDWPIASWLLETKRIDVKPIISKVIPLEDIQKAFRELSEPDTTWIQAVVTLE